MERTEIMSAMAKLNLRGMTSAFDEIITTAVGRQQEPKRIVAGLLIAGINQKLARAITYPLTIARPPLAKDSDDVTFDVALVSETLGHDLAGGHVKAALGKTQDSDRWVC